MSRLPGIQQLISGDVKALARIISLVENEASGYEEILQQLPLSEIKITGITGSPGAGKSTLVDALIEASVQNNKRIGVLCVDPSSPFHGGALLGDRIRMNQWYNHPNVFIRSLASRGNLGGISAAMIEITDVMKAAPFDHIFIETVGIGQSEIDIAALADTTIVVLVPEGGDEIQSMKAGLMEIADVFVVNKADRPGADLFVKNLRAMLSPDFNRPSVPIVKTIATAKSGIAELTAIIQQHQEIFFPAQKKIQLLAEKVYKLICKKRLQDVSKEDLMKSIAIQSLQKDFNLYRFANHLAEKGV